MGPLLFLAFLGAAAPALAATPPQLLQDYTAQAARLEPGFTPSAQRGEVFFHRRFGISEKMPACASCHTDNPATAGRHAVTGKTIQPLAPAFNGERFSDGARVEKWFGRNCREVVGRVCTPAEKADFIQYLLEVRR